MPIKKIPHITFPDEVKLEISELESLLKDLNVPLEEHINNVFCTCTGSTKKLINFQVYLNKHYDVVLHGKCCNCGKPNSKYIDINKGDSKTAITKKLKKIYTNRIKSNF